MKSSFVLLMTIFLVVLFSIYSLSIIETSIFSSNLNKLKYLHIQANVHMLNIKNYIKTHSHDDIMTVKLDDNRFSLNISKITNLNSSLYYVTIETKDETPVRIVSKF